uniref:Malate dehydrogenase, cytoplasmic n=1 Tax=Timema douglasi TaxID=61478 RepID=A0A7R8VM22_TIMDO|nr:unnamed protein product [Timema douglasi]
MRPTIRVAVTGAASQLCSSLLYQIAKGAVFGEQQPLILQLHDSADNIPRMQGDRLDVQSAGFHLIQDIIVTADLEEAIKEADAAFLLNSQANLPGHQHKDVVKATVNTFKDIGRAIDRFGKKEILVLIVGHPAFNNAWVCSQCAPTICRKNFTALSLLDLNMAKSFIALRLQVCVFPDVKYATVEMSGEMMDVYKAVGDDRWLMGDFVQTVQLRHITAMGDPSDLWSLSMAVAAGDHMKSLWCGLPGDSWTCMGVMSDGSYEVPEGIFFSFPVRVRDRKWSITVQLRHITAMGDPSDLWSLSMAVAAGDHMKSLWCGLPGDSWTCMGVMSDGSYEVPEGIFFSFPVRVRDRKWSIVEVHDFGGSDSPAEAEERSHGHDCGGRLYGADDVTHEHGQYELGQEHHAAHYGDVCAQTSELCGLYGLSCAAHLELG